MTTETSKKKNSRLGQALVEFALVIPILLLILWGIIEFARIFQGYLTVQHAAREGARYAITGQSILLQDDDGIPGNNSPGEVWANRATSIISKTHEAALGLKLNNIIDTPINQWTANQSSPYYFDVVLDPASGGDPYGLGGQDIITVTVHYNVPILTPLVKNILGGVIHVTGQVMMQNEAFDPTPGARSYATIPAGTATATPIGGATATATINFSTPTSTPPVTGTATITPTITNTPTNTPIPPTSTPLPPTSTPTTPVDTLLLSKPLTEGDTIITGAGTPGNTVTLRDFSQPNAPVIGTGTIQPDGTFSINVASLIAYHVIVGVAGTASDYAIVQPLATATSTPTTAPTATPAATCFTSSTTQSNIPGSADATAFTLSNLTGIDDGDKLKVTVDDGAHVWEYKIDFKGNPATIDKIQIKLDGNKVYERKNMGMAIPASIDLLDMFSVTGDTTNYNYGNALVGIGSANTMTVDFTKDNGATAGACVTTAGGSTPPPTPPPSGNSCFTSAAPYTKNNIPGSADVVDFTLSNLTGIDDGDKLKVTVDDGAHVWEYKIDFKGNPVKIDKIQIKLDGAKVYNPGGGMGLTIPASLNLLDMTTVTGDTTNYDYDNAAVGIVSPNTMTVEFTKDNGATAGACVAVSAAAPPTATPSPTPTATPSAADLVITSMRVITSTAVTVSQPITVEVVIKNQGSIDVSSLSWAYLYGDPATPPTTGVPGDSWVGIDALVAGAQITVTLNYPGFATPGDHLFYAQADTWNQISEINEANNVFGPMTVTVGSGGGPAATPTPTATAVPNPGGISGSTSLLINGDLVPIGQVALEARVGANVIATTISDAAGAFDFGMTLPAGTYDVYGAVTVSNVLYTDLQVGVIVVSGSSTIISLILTP